MAFVAGSAAVSPVFALRWGGVTSAVVILSTLNTFRAKLPDYLAAALALVGVLSMFWSVDVDATTLAYKNQLGALAVFVAIRAVAARRRSAAIIALGYLLGSLYALYELWTQNAGSAVSFEFAITDDRYSFQGINVNYLAYVFATAAAVVVLLWTTGPKKLAKMVLALVAVVLYLGVVQTGTRGGVVALGSLALWVIVARFRFRWALVTLCMGGAVAAIVITTGVADEFLSPDGRSPRETGDLNRRLSIWPLARQVFADHLFFGAGQGTFRVQNAYGLVAHNAILELGTGLGLVGVALFLGVIYAALIRSTRSMGAGPRALLVGAILSVSWPILLSGSWDQSPAAWVAFALFSMASTVRREVWISSPDSVNNLLPVSASRSPG